MFQSFRQVGNVILFCLMMEQSLVRQLSDGCTGTIGLPFIFRARRKYPIYCLLILSRRIFPDLSVDVSHSFALNCRLAHVSFIHGILAEEKPEHKMKRLEAKYAALHVFSNIDKLGNPKVTDTILLCCFGWLKNRHFFAASDASKRRGLTDQGAFMLRIVHFRDGSQSNQSDAGWTDVVWRETFEWSDEYWRMYRVSPTVERYTICVLYSG